MLRISPGTSTGVVAGAILGIAAGTGAYTFWYGRGGAYLLDDPAACANCHVMQAQLDAWTRSSHRSVATCNECHTPHGLVHKYLVKAQNGFWHSFAFTTGRFVEPIGIKAGNREITESRCRACHAEMAAVVDGTGTERRSCLGCHGDVGHNT